MLPAGQVKPQGVPQIDWTHPLAQNLAAYYFDTGLGFYIDLVSGNVAGQLGTGSTFPAIDASPYGTGFAFPAVNPHTIQDPNVFSRTSWAAPFAFAIGWYQRGPPGTGTFATYSGLEDASSNDQQAIAVASLTNTIYSVSNGASISVAGVPASNAFHVGVVTTTGASAQTAYQDGVQVGTGTQSNTYTNANIHWVAANEGYNGTATNDLPNANVFFHAIWYRQLTPDEARLLYTYPYSLLVPAEPEMQIIQDDLQAQILL